MEDEVTYAVWVESDGGIKRTTQPFGVYNCSYAQSIVDEFNADEADLAKREMRPVNRRFYLVRATTRYEEV